MKAVRIHGWNSDPSVDIVAEPQVEAGRSLVRIEAAAVSHLDLTVASGQFGVKPDLPYIGGVEGAGVVVESDSFPAGTRVIVRGGGVGLVRPGTWAEFVSVPTKALIQAPDGLDPALAATFFVPSTTAHTALNDVGRLGRWFPGVEASSEAVVVGGAAGAVGSLVLQLALRQGCRAIAVITDQAQAALLPDGCETVLVDDEEASGRLTEGRPASLLIDTLGGAGLAQRMRWVAAGGRAVSIGYVLGTGLTLDLPNWLLDDVALLPINMMRRSEEATSVAAEMAALLQSGELLLEVERFTMDETAEVVRRLRDGRLRGRAVICP